MDNAFDFGCSLSKGNSGFVPRFNFHFVDPVIYDIDDMIESDNLFEQIIEDFLVLPSWVDSAQRAKLVQKFVIKKGMFYIIFDSFIGLGMA